jgi:hypothetical protein
MLQLAGCSTPGERPPLLVPTTYVRAAQGEEETSPVVEADIDQTRSVQTAFAPAKPLKTTKDKKETPAPAQAPEPESASASSPPAQDADPLNDPVLERASCLSCGAPILGGMSHTCPDCDSGGCVPGQPPCYPIEAHTLAGRFLANLHDILNCPDPCYSPSWVPEANASFFTDFPRPKTLTRLRFDGGWDMVDPDRAEFFWARADGKGAGPKFEGVRHHPSSPGHAGHPTPRPPPERPPGIGGPTPGGVTGNPPGRPPGIGGPTPGGVTGNPPGRPPGLGNPSRPGHRPTHPHAPRPTVLKFWPAINFAQLYLYTEMAAERGSFFIEIPYRSWSAFSGGGAAGFSDLNVGTKSVLLDSELLLVTFQFKTYIPTGSAGAGLGTGHTALEPSLISALKLTPDAYLQSQLAQWVPIGGDPHYQGGVLHYHFSLNQTLYRIAPDAPLIGTFEFSGWSFQNGHYTDPYTGTKGAGGDSYFSIGPGLRQALGPKFDCGVGTAFALSEPHWANQLLRVELRLLY